MKRALIAIAGMLLLQGCGFEPLYADTSAMGGGPASMLSMSKSAGERSRYFSVELVQANSQNWK